jgi:hypothetical protein
MKYETPQMTALIPAINAIQSTSAKGSYTNIDSYNGSKIPESDGVYTDWE